MAVLRLREVEADIFPCMQQQKMKEARSRAKTSRQEKKLVASRAKKSVKATAARKLMKLVRPRS